MKQSAQRAEIARARQNQSDRLHVMRRCTHLQHGRLRYQSL